MVDMFTMAQKRSNKKKSPKVKLSTKKVYILTCLICILCILSLTLNIILTNADSSKAKDSLEQKETTEKTIHQTQSKEEKPTPLPEPKNTQSSTVKKESEKEVKKETSKKQEKSDKNENKKTQSTKNETKHQQTQNSTTPSKQPQQPAPSDENSIQKDTITSKPVQKEPFDIPQAKKGATIVIIIDDAGLNVSNTKKYAELPFPLTIAVLPKLKHTKDCAYVVRSNGKELILHQPMQSQNLNLDPGPGAITDTMSTYEIAQTVIENLSELGPGVKGLNNHEGSLITANVIKIGAVLDVCDSQGIYFFDSRTTSQTQAPQAALERDMKIFEKNGPYLDNVISREEMLKQMYKTLEVANKKGIAIIIGHVDKSANILPDLLKDMYPYLVKKGYRFATPSQLK